MSPFSWQDQNLWGLGLGFITDWRVVICDIFVPQTKEPVLKHRCLNLLGRALQRNAYALENPTPKRITWVKGERFWEKRPPLSVEMGRGKIWMGLSRSGSLTELLEKEVPSNNVDSTRVTEIGPLLWQVKLTCVNLTCHSSGPIYDTLLESTLYDGKCKLSFICTNRTDLSLYSKVTYTTLY